LGDLDQRRAHGDWSGAEAAADPLEADPVANHKPIGGIVVVVG
jgi:hypothetical protein